MAYFLQTVYLKTGMEKNRVEYHQKVNKISMERIKAELMQLDRQMINADGIQLKPSQCYRFEIDPLHVLFNTNCPVIENNLSPTSTSYPHRHRLRNLLHQNHNHTGYRFRHHSFYPNDKDNISSSHHHIFF